MPFSATFVLLQQEAFLARGTLSLGLTALRNATFPDKATFYCGFFNTSIALERVMKLIVVTDHMLQHRGLAPTKANLKTYGHDLVSLYASCVTAASNIGLSNVHTPQAPSLERELLDFFSEFAKYARYHNLDALSSSVLQDDPLARWGRILNEVLNSDTPKTKVAAQLAKAKALHTALEGKVHAIQHGMDGTLLPLKRVFTLPAMHAVATPYTMVRVFNLLRPLLETVSAVGRKGFYDIPPRARGPHVPEFSEFFVHFGGSDTEVRRKKRWP